MTELVHRRGPLEPVWAEAWLDLLGHKGEPWLWQIGRCLHENLDPLITDFYAAVQAGRPVASLCVSSNGPLAILGHVYVRPECRRQGLARRLLERALVGREGQRIYLGTEPDSAAERLYADFGFVALSPGLMARGPEPPGWEPLQEPLNLRHWPLLVHWGALQEPPQGWEGKALMLLRPDNTPGC